MEEGGGVIDYSSRECCSKLSNFKDALKKYDLERKVVISKVWDNPEELVLKLWKEYLSSDLMCTKNSGHGDMYPTHSCIPCQNLSIFIDHDITDINEPIKISEKMVRIIKIDNVSTRCEISGEDQIIAANFLKKNKILLSCGSQEVQDLIFLKVDTFTNNLLIWWIINDILEAENQVGLKLYNGYICRDFGFLLCEYPSIGGYDKLILKMGMNSDVAYSIINKLKTKLRILSHYYFTHGMPDIEFLIFNENDEGDFDLNIVDFSYSSLTIGKTRIYPGGLRANMILRKGNLDIDIKDGKYRIMNDREVLFYYIRHGGLPLYSSSFDYYCFLISLMKRKEFREAVNSDSNLRNEWESLWESEDLQEVNKLVEKDADLMKIISGKWLICNVVEA